MPSWITAILQIGSSLFGIFKNISDGRNAPPVKAAAVAQQETNAQGAEANEVSAALDSANPAKQKAALEKLREDAAE